jgi:nucleotide sugar dehydrogenase
MNKKSIACIGCGFVGGSLTTVFAERNFDVYVYDKVGKVAPGGIPGSRTNIADLVEHCETLKGFTGIYFVCLPTPMNEDGSADLSIVESALGELANVPGDRIAVVKSTVPPGSVESWNEKFKETGLRVVFAPEFLREASALDDMRNQTRIILGGPRPYINNVKSVFQAAFPTVPIIKTSSTNAELVKYVTNCFLATKVSFANEIYQLCGALDEKGLNVDYDRVIECATMDERLGISHWRVPSFETDENGKNLLGFSLSCFPKDLNALICKEKELGLNPTMLEATWKKNLEVRPQKDWEKMVGRAVSKKE